MSGKGGLIREYAIRILAPTRLLTFIFDKPIQPHNTVKINGSSYACVCTVNGNCKCGVYYTGRDDDYWDVLLTEPNLKKK